MGSKHIRTVIIEDHLLLVEVYELVLKGIDPFNETWDFKIERASCFDTAYALLEELENESQSIDLVFLDLNIPPKMDSRFHMEDIGVSIRNRFPEAKIIISADYKNNYQINTVLRRIKPEGFLITTDLNFDVLRPAIIEVLNNPPFYSKSVLRSLHKSKGHDISLDKWDVIILYELSRGVKMKMLPDILPLSLGAIEKRKRQMKFYFGIEDGGDRLLLEKAHAYGFI